MLEQEGAIPKLFPQSWEHVCMYVKIFLAVTALGGTFGSRLVGIRHTGCVRLFVFQVMICNKVHLAVAETI